MTGAAGSAEASCSPSTASLISSASISSTVSGSTSMAPSVTSSTGVSNSSVIRMSTVGVVNEGTSDRTSSNTDLDAARRRCAILRASVAVASSVVS